MIEGRLETRDGNQSGSPPRGPDPYGRLAAPTPAALRRYRAMAFTTASLLIVIVFVGLPLQFLGGDPSVANTVGTIHGFLYLIYLVTAFQLTRQLHVPKWQMALVLLAGTVPFCAFIAERKMTQRFEALRAPAQPSGARKRHLTRPPSRFRRRWLSHRALLLHLEVAIVAPGCAVAGWWQATRALAGNGLSWFYSVEWPVFAILAIAGWWYLIHEDPDAYRARKRRPVDPSRPDVPTSPGAQRAKTSSCQPVTTVERSIARLAALMAGLVGLEFALGIAALVFVPPGRPSGLEPTQGLAIYLVHSAIGLPISLGALVFLVRVRRSTRLSRLSGWTGAVGVGIAAIGGTLTVYQPLRLLGMGLMLVGAVVAGFGYLFPSLEKMGS